MQLLRMAGSATDCFHPEHFRYALARYYLCSLVASSQRLLFHHRSRLLWPHPNSIPISEVPPATESADLDLLEDSYTRCVGCIHPILVLC